MIVAYALLGFTLAGCSGNEFTVDPKKNDDDAGHTTPDGSVGPDAADPDETPWSVDPTVREVFEELHEAECQKIFRCCDAQERAIAFGIEGDQQTCNRSQGLFPLELELAMITEAIEAGRLEFNPEMVEVCLEAYRNQDCSDWSQSAPLQTRLAGCMEATAALVQAGGECVHDHECLTGYCESSDDDDWDDWDDDEAAMGTCAERAPAGEDCSESICAAGTYCETFTQLCTNQLMDGNTCSRDRECRSGACVENFDGDLACARPLAICHGGE